MISNKHTCNCCQRNGSCLLSGTPHSTVWGSHTSIWVPRDPSHYWFLYHNSKLINNLFGSYSNSNIVIATNVCTCHDSTAAMACVKFCCDMISRNGLTAKRKFASFQILSFLIWGQNWVTVANSWISIKYKQCCKCIWQTFTKYIHIRII